MRSKKDYINLSKFISFVLRHKPETIGIHLDKRGWTEVNALISGMNRYGKEIDKETLFYIVETCDKKRYALNEDQTKIRAYQGHTVKVDLGYRPKVPPEILFHGTGEKYVDSIRFSGIDRKGRHHVHLSIDKETAFQVGSRHGKPVIFKVMSKEMYLDGFEFFESDNGVWLTEKVPVRYLQKE